MSGEEEARRRLQSMLNPHWTPEDDDYDSDVSNGISKCF